MLETAASPKTALPPGPEGPLPADEAARVRLAARATTSAATLLALANDPATTVRAAVALNPVTEAATDTHLVHDSDERVRALLAGKMARLLPGLSGRERSAAQTHVHGMLRILADDAAVRVRIAMAEALTTVTAAPRDVIMKLARDPAVVVSGLVVRFSPLLTDVDLLELLATPPHPATAVAVASRAGLSATVASDIVEHADNAAVVALLSNRTAAIQEATLDSLIGRAGDHPEWHEPLTCRPTLPVRAIRALSLIVAGHLLDVLANRPDVPAGLAQELRGQMAARLGETSVPSEAGLLDAARRLHASGRLDEAAFLDACATGDARQAAVILSVASDVALAAIDRAVALRSPKALVSIVGRAGFTMRAGCMVQSLLGRLAAGEMLAPTAEGAFPLSLSEMDWQIELLGQPGR